MIDTIRLRLSNINPQNLIYVKTLLTDIEEKTFEQSGVSYTRGKYKNFIIVIGFNSISIQGSICKYFLGSNIEELSAIETQVAFYQLEKGLNLNLSEAIIHRIDIGANIHTSLKPSIYFDTFGVKNNMLRTMGFGSLYYKVKKREICIYDKASELKLGDTSRNILRIELKIRSLGQVRSCLKLEKLKDLLNSKYYSRVIELWFNEKY